MKGPSFLASLVAAVAAVAPARAAIVTYDVSVSSGLYQTSSSRYDYGTGVTTFLGELAPAVAPLALTGRFVVDSTQGSQFFPFPSFPFSSSSGTFINSTVTADQPTPTLATSLTGATNTASLTTYDYVGGFMSLRVADYAQSLFFDNDGNVTRAVNEFFEHTLLLGNISEFTYVDGKAFPKLTGPGITAQLSSTRSIDDYDYSTGVVVTHYLWEARGSGTLGYDATATDGSAADVPEPAALALFGVGLLGIGLRRRRR